MFRLLQFFGFACQSVFLMFILLRFFGLDCFSLFSYCLSFYGSLALTVSVCFLNVKTSMMLCLSLFQTLFISVRQGHAPISNTQAGIFLQKFWQATKQENNSCPAMLRKANPQLPVMSGTGVLQN